MNSFKITQKIFPFRKKIVTFMPEKEKLLIQEKYFGKSEEWYVNVAELSESYERIKQRASYNLFYACGITLLTLCIVFSFIGEPISEDNPIFLTIIFSILIATIIFAWRSYFINKREIQLYLNKTSGKSTFYLYTNLPNRVVFNDFVNQLEEKILECGGRDYFTRILNGIPTHVLVKEFNDSYLKELGKRGVDIGPFLSFTKMQYVNTNEKEC